MAQRAAEQRFGRFSTKPPLAAKPSLAYNEIVPKGKRKEVIMVDITELGMFNSPDTEPIFVDGKFIVRRGLLDFLVKVRVYSEGATAESVHVAVDSSVFGYSRRGIDFDDFEEEHGRPFDNDDLECFIYRVIDDVMGIGTEKSEND